MMLRTMCFISCNNSFIRTFERNVSLNTYTRKKKGTFQTQYLKILQKCKSCKKCCFLCFGHWESETESCSVVSNSLRPHLLYSPWNSLGQKTGVGSLSFLQGIFPTQGSNPGLLHCRQILYLLSHQGSWSLGNMKPNLYSTFSDLITFCISNFC